MSADTPHTAAWDRLRDTVATVAADYRAAGHTVVEAYADHGTIKAPNDGPVKFVFTVAGETVTTLTEQMTANTICRTEIQYVDTGGYRLYLLEVHQSDDSTIALVAGGIEKRLLVPYADTSGAAQTKVRSISNIVGLSLSHDDRTPFFEGLE
jgi:hypothetical protein